MGVLCKKDPGGDILCGRESLMTNKRLKIAVWHNLPSGGGKRQLYNHVKGLVERGHYLESWCPDTADQKYLPLNNIIKENIIPLNKKNRLFNYPSKPLRVVKELLAVIEEHCKICAEEINNKEFDILYANACMYLRTTPIAEYIKLPSVIYLNEPYRYFYEALPELPWIAPKSSYKMQLSLGPLKDYIIKRATINGIRLQARAELEYAKQFDLILANSIFSRESILRTYNLESSVCYLGIDTDYFKPEGGKKENYVVGLGTIYLAKGVDRAIRAISTIRKEKRPDLIWIGNGAYKRDLEKFNSMANELGVNFIPKMNIPDTEVIALLSRAAVMIYTSRLEPFGLAPLEANACGTAVVGIAEGGIRETVKDGINGFLANDANPHVLGELLYRFTDNPKLALEMGVKSTEYVTKYWNMESCTDNIESVLMQLRLGGRGHGDY